MEQLWERSRAERKETNRKLSKRNRKKRTGNQPWMKGRSDGDERNRSLDGKPLGGGADRVRKGRTEAE